MPLTADQIVTDKTFLSPSYPEINVRVTRWDQNPAARNLFHRTEIRSDLSVPALAQAHAPDTGRISAGGTGNSVWFELAPGERPEDLQFPDEELIDNITPVVMKCLRASGFFELLDDLMCPTGRAGTRTVLGRLPQLATDSAEERIQET